jgi:hypothetical protein
MFSRSPSGLWEICFWEEQALKDQNKILDTVLKVVSYILAATVGASLTFVLLVQFGHVSKDGGMTKLEQLQLLIEERFIG